MKGELYIGSISPQYFIIRFFDFFTNNCQKARGQNMCGMNFEKYFCFRFKRVCHREYMLTPVHLVVQLNDKLQSLLISPNTKDTELKDKETM